jgi:hypothetical protein
MPPEKSCRRGVYLLFVFSNRQAMAGNETPMALVVLVTDGNCATTFGLRDQLLTGFVHIVVVVVVVVC